MTDHDHYYTSHPRAESRPGEVQFKVAEREITLQTDSGVFSKQRIDRGTRLLLTAFEKGTVPLPAAGNMADLGCGYGTLGIALAVLRPDAAVYMTDINERAVRLARANAKRHGLANVQVAAGDGLAPFAGVTFNTIVCNPPLRIGKQQVHTLLTNAFHTLDEGGTLSVVIRTQQGAKSLEKFLATLGPVAEAEKGGGFRVYVTTRA